VVGGCVGGRVSVGAESGVSFFSQRPKCCFESGGVMKKDLKN